MAPRPSGSRSSRKLGCSRPNRRSEQTSARVRPWVRKQTFRDALLHRLAGFQILVPPLRNRREDIGMLLVRFLREELETLDRVELIEDPNHQRPWLAAPVVARLARYDWPGNVRQLRNVARQLAIRGVDWPQLRVGPDLEALLPSLAKGRPAEDASPTEERVLPTRSGADAPTIRSPSGTQYVSPSDVPPERLVEALRAHGFRVGPAAKSLGLSRTSMYSLMEATPLVRKASDLSAEEIERALQASDGKLSNAALDLEVSERALKLRMTALGLVRRGSSV